jgi:hypothetical protein
MHTTVYNATTQKEQSFEEAVKETAQSFMLLGQNSGNPDYEGWRQQVKERYPFDYWRVLTGAKEKLDEERKSA